MTNNEEKVIIPIDQITDFPNHPYKVKKRWKNAINGTKRKRNGSNLSSNSKKKRQWKIWNDKWP